MAALNFSKKIGSSVINGFQNFNFREPLLGELLTNFGLPYTKIKLKYDDLDNIKTDRVYTVFFNLLQIKQSKFFGTPGCSLISQNK